ncbi:cytochrome c3 family protein [Shewanella sp. KX20019]|uniref:cytochrome c3 family protein n=1 Tax=Shewanella sp. KX20019 TaxID=2803864 RepID=UPI001F2FFEAA|nr:cytochrome c3 family protein [Shewanella sp. KX20019]
MLTISLIGLILTPLTTLHAKTVELVINTDKKCIMCHKKNGKMYGVHANNLLEMRCQNCHGKKEGHPRKKSNLIKFGGDSVNIAAQQTAVCTKCHEPDDLAKADWTHVVHSDKVNCAKCHKLHSETDPVIAIQTKERGQLCVSCHKIQ